MKMKEPIFNTSLTDEEIKRNFENTNLFDGIMQGLEEALAFEKESLPCILKMELHMPERSARF